jgi:hypothetical protein
MSTGSSRYATLVANADDFGRTAEINEGIELAFNTGIVSSTSIVANSPAFDHAVTIGLRNPELISSVGKRCLSIGALGDVYAGSIHAAGASAIVRNRAD